MIISHFLKFCIAGIMLYLYSYFFKLCIIYLCLRNYYLYYLVCVNAYSNIIVHVFDFNFYVILILFNIMFSTNSDIYLNMLVIILNFSLLLTVNTPKLTLW